ncbi:hypothetical protein STAQ_25750 [Allostella sp. ATCC 35155]|nr:hypothetical protein STAQ_25750 [Stella sp. ATCC 35155]
MIVQGLLQNIALLTLLCLAQRFLVLKWYGTDVTGQVLSGFLFGAAAAIGMLFAVQLAPGIFFDARSVVLAVAAMLGGPVVGVVAGGIAAAMRLGLGGLGSVVALGSIAISVLVGLAFRIWQEDRGGRPGAGTFLALGVAVHLPSLALFALLPVGDVGQILRPLALPYLGLLIPATVALGLGLLQIEAFGRADRDLAASEDRFRTLVDSASVAIWEEDISGVVRRLDELRTAGVGDLRLHLAAHPELVEELASAVRVLRVNPAARQLFGATADHELLGPIARFFLPESRMVFVDLLVALWDRRSDIAVEVRLQTLDGRPFTALLSLPIPADVQAAERVPVSFVDLSERKAMEIRLAEERRRLEEIIWGTNVGTWEWNVQSGAVTFNERWAEIAGYTLAELSPISIATWERLAEPEDLARSGALLQEVFAGTLEFYECEIRMRHKSGATVWVLDRGKIVERDAEGRPLRMSGTHADISARKAAEVEAARLADIRRLIVLCHGVVLRETDETAMLEKLVTLLVESRGYAVAWVGVPLDDPERTVRPIAWAGAAAGYLDRLSVHWSDDALGSGPTGRAIRTGKSQVSSDIARDPTMAAWAELAREVGLRSCMAIPVPGRDKVAAVLIVYADVEDRFGAEEATLLTEFAANLGLAIQTRQAEAERERFRGQLAQAAIGAIDAVAATVEKRDPYTSGHQARVARLAVAIAKELGWEAFRIEGLRLGAMVHDIGKIYVPAEILNRPGRLTEAEFAIIKAHPEVGYEILEKSEFPWPIQEMVRQHHERPDGTGYPRGLKGEEILPEAQIIAVADVMEAMTSHRPYRPGLGLDRAIEEIEAGIGTRYDPQIADACLRLVREGRFRWDAEAAAA